MSQPNVVGEQLANRFITLLADKDVAGLQDFLSEAYMIQRADGSFTTKADYLTRIPTIGPFTISGVTA